MATHRTHLLLALLALASGCEGAFFGGGDGGDSGDNEPPSILTSSKLHLPFGSQNPGQSHAVSATLTNTGEGPLRVTRASMRGTAFLLTQPALPRDIGPGESIDFVVERLPAAPCTDRDVLTFESTAQNPRLAIGLTGFSTGGPCVGAIRWDGWNAGENWPDGTPNDIGLWSESIMTPTQWRYRLPFFATVSDSGGVQIRLDTQEKMDQEIAYAAAGGLDYWAFDFYGNAAPLTRSLKLYMSSSRKADLRFALVITLWRTGAAGWRNQVINYLKDSQYVTVLGGRPLVYSFGGTLPTAIDVADLRASAAAAGLPNPYMVWMTWDTNDGQATALGFDAVSAYANLPPGPDLSVEPYSSLAAADRADWDGGESNNLKVVPIVTTGWDPRPVFANPQPGQSGYTAVTTGSPSEIAAHLTDAFNWVRAKPTVADSRHVIMYAWNEYAEGGWLAPLRETGSARLDAIRQVILGPPTFDNMPPVVSVVTPGFGAIATGTLGLEAWASDNVRVRGVQFLLDGTPIGAELTAPPFTMSFDTQPVADGAHVLSAVARDEAGNTARAVPIPVTVSH